jgi:predicted DNA-binding ribbon-helix-helix protein
MPVVSFSISNFYYRCLEQMARGRGISISKLLKQIVESHIDALINNRRLIISDYISAINNQNIDVSINNAALINTDYISAINNKDIDEAIKYPDTDKELAKRIEHLEKSIAELKDAVSVLAKEFKDSIRKQQDLIIAYTGKADQVLQRLSQLTEVVERLVVSGPEAREGEGYTEKRRYVERGRQKEDMSKSAKARKGKRDACSILKEQLVVLESEVADKIRNRDVFFASLERCSVRIDTARERIAVESGFWEKFVEKLGRVNTNNEEKIAQVLDPLELKLFKTLKESALIAFDAMKKAWILVEKPKTPKVQAQVEPQDDESWLLQYVDLDSSAEAEATNTND